MAEQGGMGLGFEPEERLPWLEPVEEDAEPGNMTARLIGLVLVGLLLIGAVVGGLWWWQNSAAGGRGELITAPEGPYKVAPKAEPGRFSGDGTIAVAAAEGQTTSSVIDASRLPEAPVPPPAAGGRAPAPASGAPAPSAATPAATPTGSGLVQLGAFASEAAASRAWESLKTRFEWLEPINSQVVPAEIGGRTVYRLRAAAGTAAAARTLCNRLRVAGETCLAI